MREWRPLARPKVGAALVKLLRVLEKEEDARKDENERCEQQIGHGQTPEAALEVRDAAAVAVLQLNITQ